MLTAEPPTKKNGGKMNAVIEDNRYIFSHEIETDPQAEHPGYAVRRKKRKRSVSTFNVVVILVAVAMISLLYTWNVVSVIRLSRDVTELTARYNTIISSNEVIRAEINRKTSFDRISQLAIDDVGLMNPKDAPNWFEIDRDKINELKEQ
jgi:cell division protein FtsL